MRPVADAWLAGGAALRGPVLVGFAMWALLWLALNAPNPGPSIFTNPGDARSLFPLVVVLVALAIVVRGQRVAVPWAGPSGLLVGYAIIGLGASLWLSPSPNVAAYWALAYAAVPLVMVAWFAGTPDHAPLELLLRFNQGAAVALTVAFFGIAIVRLDLVDLLRQGLVERLYGNYALMTNPLWANSNGVGRFAAITFLVGLSALLGSRRRSRFLFVVPVALALVMLLYTMSRGALAGLFVASLLVVYLQRGGRTLLAVAGVGAAVLVAGAYRPIAAYLERGQPRELLLSLTGRTDTWSDVWGLVGASPWIGWGFHADRLFVGQHVHNAWLHALVQAGALGAVLFAAAWLVGLAALLRLGILRRFPHVPAHYRPGLIDATALLAFFAVRSLVESSGAFFGVDALFIVPLLAYVHARAAWAEVAVVAAEPATMPRKVLAGAYACAPPGSPTFNGGEDMLGWGIVTQLSRFNDVWFLTSGEHRAGVTAALADLRRPSLHPVFVDLPRWTRGMRKYQGTVQLYAYLWQVKAWLVAARLHRLVGFDVFHHVTYGNDWMASHAGAMLPVPYVRGPGGGAHRVPARLARRRGWRFHVVQAIRGGFQRIMRADPFFRAGQRRARVLLVFLEDAMANIPAKWRRKARYFPVNGISDEDVETARGAVKATGFQVVCAGKLLSIKGFDLGMRAFARMRERVAGARLVIVGSGPERAHLGDLARTLNIEDAISFRPWSSRAEVLRVMGESHAFLFPSMRDGGGAVVVEAMGAGIPVVCLDVGGPGQHVNEAWGIKVRATTPSEIEQALADALERLGNDPDLRERLGHAARERAIDAYHWDRLGERLDRIYDEILAPSPARGSALPRETGRASEAS